MNDILDLPADEYHADQVADVPSLSRSIAHILCTQTPAHARHAHPKLNPDFKREEAAKFDVGTSAHALLFHGEPGVEVCAFSDWRTNAAKEQRDAARAAGRLPMLTDQWAETQAMVAAAREQLAELDVAPIPFADGKPERTLVWDDDGVSCRARVDFLHDDLATIDDYKTTSRSANPDAFIRTIFSMGYDIQAAFYLRGLEAVGGSPDADFRFVAQETFPPYALSVVSLGPAAMTIAEKKVTFAIATWRRCLERDEWNGYPTQIAYAELPAWEEAAWLERELREFA